MKILITGNMGYVGPGVVKQLRSTRPYAHLVGLDSGFFADALTTTGVLPETVLNEQLFLDIRDVTPEVFQGIDSVVHLAAISNDAIGKLNEQTTYAINCLATLRLAALARQQGVRSFVFASSCSVYGIGGAQTKTETSRIHPLTAYAHSKAQAELGLRDLAGERFVVTCLRFATACGMSDRLRLDLVLNDFVASAMATGEISILSDGTPWRPLIDVHDMAAAIDWAVERDVENGGPGAVVNTGSNAWNFQVAELAELVAGELGGVKLSVNRHAPADRRSYRVGFDRFSQLAPKHVPRGNIAATIGRLRNGLRAMDFHDADFRQGPWMRLNRLLEHQAAGRLDDQLRWKHRGAVAGVVPNSNAEQPLSLFLPQPDARML